MKSSRERLEETTFEFPLKEENDNVLSTELLPWLNVRALIQLSQTNHRIHGLFADKSSFAREALLDKLMPYLEYLADIIVNEPTKENIEILQKVLNVYPDLLKRKIKKVVFKETGQEYIDYSLLQLAYAEGDDDLCLDLKPCFKLAMGSDAAAQEEIDKQIKEKFEYESEEEKQKAEAHELEIKNKLAIMLDAVIQVITNEQFNNGDDDEGKLILSRATLDAITTFRKAFDALQPRTIYKGRRSRLDTLNETNDAYVQAAWGWQEYNQCALFEDGVVSHVLLNKPQNDAMRCNQGLGYFWNDNPERFKRSRTLREKNIKFQDKLRSESSEFSSLSGSCINIADGMQRWHSTFDTVFCYANLSNAKHILLCDKKTKNLQSLCSQPKSDMRLANA